MPTAMVNFNGRITLPPQVRRNLGLKTGDNVEFVEVEKGRFAISHRRGLAPNSNRRNSKLNLEPMIEEEEQPVL
jgi:AbrB family looped-hinge helix DNA binding protein